MNVPNPSRLPVHFLQPGKLFVGERRQMIVTVLGSCVSFTLFDRRHRIAGMTHAMLPAWDGRGGRDDPRFVDAALRLALDQLDALGACRRDLEVKLFGGGDVLAPGETPTLRATVGRQNIEAALAALEREGLVLQGSCVGGPIGRKLGFDTGTGAVLLKRLPRLDRDEHSAPVGAGSVAERRR